MARKKEPKQDRLNEVSPEPDRGEIVQGTESEQIEIERRELLEALSKYLKEVDPGRRDIINLLKQQLRGAKNDEIKKQLLKEDIDAINRFIEEDATGKLSPEARKFFKGFDRLSRGRYTEYSDIYNYLNGDYGWNPEKKEKMISKWGSVNAAANAILRHLKKKFPNKKLPKNSTIRDRFF